MPVARRPRFVMLVIALAAGAFAAATPATDAAGVPFDVARLFLELNHTDGDLGLHAEIDGDEWTNLEIRHDRHQLLDISARGALRDQGLTQLAFESTEPNFLELDPVEFFDRFPEGAYEISGRAHRGDQYDSVVWLSHVLAAPAEALVSGNPAASSCGDLPVPAGTPPVVIDWLPVTSSHPTVGVAGQVVIERYQFFVEQGDMKLALDLPPWVTMFEIPPSLTAGGGVFKFEIIARTSAGNNTAIESCFTVG